MSRGCYADRFEVQAVARWGGRPGRSPRASARTRPVRCHDADLDGFSLLRALRADPALREIPVILLSARAGEECRVEGTGGRAPMTISSSRSPRGN